MEFCRKDHPIVLNGWIFAVFGLFDYLNFSKSEQVSSFLDGTLATMK